MVEYDSMRGVWHKDDIPFHKAPPPRRLHHCTPHTIALWDDGGIILRCACGGINTILPPRLGRGISVGRWRERNSR